MRVSQIPHYHGDGRLRLAHQRIRSPCRGGPPVEGLAGATLVRSPFALEAAFDAATWARASTSMLRHQTLDVGAGWVRRSPLLPGPRPSAAPPPYIYVLGSPPCAPSTAAHRTFGCAATALTRKHCAFASDPEGDGGSSFHQPPSPIPQYLRAAGAQRRYGVGPCALRRASAQPARSSLCPWPAGHMPLLPHASHWHRHRRADLELAAAWVWLARAAAA